MITDLLAGLSSQAPPPGPDPEPYLGYVLAGLAVVVFYAGTRVDTDSHGRHRRALTRALFALSAVLILVGLATGVDPGS